MTEEKRQYLPDSVVKFYSYMTSCRGVGDEFIELLSNAFRDDPDSTVKLLFKLRDKTNGYGERDLFKLGLVYLESVSTDTAASIIPYIPKYGRYDDLFVFNHSLCINKSINLYRQHLIHNDTKYLASKWVPRKIKSQKERAFVSKLRTAMNKTPKEFRKTLSENCSKFFVDDIKGYKNKNNLHAKRFYMLRPHEFLMDTGGACAFSNLIEASTLVVVDHSQKMGDLLLGYNHSNFDVAKSIKKIFSNKNPEILKNFCFSFVVGNCKKNAKFITDDGEQVDNHDKPVKVNAILENLLKFSIENKLKENEVPEHLLFFSCKGFDEAVDEKVNLKMLEKKFKNKKLKMPKIIFWDMTHNVIPNAIEDSSGIIHVSGFSSEFSWKVLECIARGNLFQIGNISVQDDCLQAINDYSDIQVKLPTKVQKSLKNKI